MYLRLPVGIKKDTTEVVSLQLAKVQQQPRTS